MIVRLRETTSTQDEARSLLLAGETELQYVISDYQSAGRGRQGAIWHAPPSTSLLATFVVRLTDPSQNQIAALSLLAGLSALYAIKQISGVECNLKWPNDLFIRDRKLGGVLVELVHLASESAFALIGIGINVNVKEFPRDLSRAATSLLLETGSHHEVALLAPAIYKQIADCKGQSLHKLVHEWREHDGTTGRRYVAASQAGALEGEAVGIGEGGELLLRIESGEVISVFSATCIESIS